MKDVEIETLEYKGFFAKIFYSEKDDIFYGKIENISGLVTFENFDCGEIEEEFHAAVDDYLEMCREIKRLIRD